MESLDNSVNIIIVELNKILIQAARLVALQKVMDNGPENPGTCTCTLSMGTAQVYSSRPQRLMQPYPKA